MKILSSEKITENTEQTKENQNNSDTLDSNKNFNKEEKKIMKNEQEEGNFG